MRPPQFLKRKKKIQLNWSVLVSQTSLSYYFPFLFAPLGILGALKSNHFTYSPSNKKAFNQSKLLTYFTIRNMKERVTMISEAA